MATPPLRSATNGHPSRSSTGSRPALPDARSNHVPARRPRRAPWAAACLAGLVLVALAVLVTQNTQTVPVSFLAMEGSVPLSLLITGVVAVVVLLGAGAARARRGGRDVRDT